MKYLYKALAIVIWLVVLINTPFFLLGYVVGQLSVPFASHFERGYRKGATDSAMTILKIMTKARGERNEQPKNSNT